MKIGYACICNHDDTTKIKSCILRNASEERLKELIAHNLTALMNILQYNNQLGIKMFRISSDLIPFGSSPANTLDWKSLFAQEFLALGAYIQEKQMRVSFHPGQYTVLNALDCDVVARSVLDLQYHTMVLDAMGLNDTHKIILHVGGIYGDKKQAMARFRDVYRMLDERIQCRLVIENDDRRYHIEDVLNLSDTLHIPIVFDNLHHHILPPPTTMPETLWLAFVRRTWQPFDGTQKMHYSEQDVLRQPGAHAKSIDVPAFISFVNAIQRTDLDIMLEVKDKNASAIACIQALKKANILWE